jgi:hypothetical protein
MDTLPLPEDVDIELKSSTDEKRFEQVMRETYCRFLTHKEIKANYLNQLSNSTSMMMQQLQQLPSIKVQLQQQVTLDENELFAGFNPVISQEELIKLQLAKLPALTTTTTNGQFESQAINGEFHNGLNHFGGSMVSNKLISQSLTVNPVGFENGQQSSSRSHTPSPHVNLMSNGSSSQKHHHHHQNQIQQQQHLNANNGMTNDFRGMSHHQHLHHHQQQQQHQSNNQLNHHHQQQQQMLFNNLGKFNEMRFKGLENKCMIRAGFVSLNIIIYGPKLFHEIFSCTNPLFLSNLIR